MAHGEGNGIPTTIRVDADVYSNLLGVKHKLEVAGQRQVSMNEAILFLLALQTST